MTGPRPAPRFERLVHQPPFAIDFLDGVGPDLVIAFSSVGHDPARPPAPEFVGTATGHGAGRRALFVSDASRSWANDPGFAPALRAAYAHVAARAPVQRLLCLGLSMGGFAALVAAQVLPVDVVLAFGPQWSVVPGAIPAEDRWSDWTSRLTAPVWPTAPVPQGRWICLFHGTVDDRAQAMAFPRQPGLDHLLFAGLGHSALVPHLKARGVLGGLVDAALAGDRRRLLRIAASAGAVRRR